MEKKHTRIIKNVVQAIVVVGLGYLVRHKVAETDAVVWIAAGWLLTAWVVLRVGLGLKRGYANFRTHTESGINIESIDKLTTASMPPWTRGYYLIEKRAYRGFWRTLTLKPVTRAGEFSLAGGRSGQLKAAGLLLLVAAGTVFAALFLPTVVTGVWPRVFAFAGVGYALLYAVIWIVGERRSLKEGGHRIAHDELILDLGIRCSGAVALDSIASCSLHEPGMARIANADVWMVSPGESPNVQIQLFRTTELAITSFGSPREISMRFIALYVDQPAQFVEAMSEAIAGAGRVRA